MSVSSLSSLAAAFNAQSSSTSATFKSSSSSSSASSGSLTAKQQQQYNALQTISAYKTTIANSLGDLLGASNSKAGKSTSVSSVATGLAAVFSASNTPNFNIEFNNIQNAYIDRINKKTVAYQALAKNDPNTAHLQAQLSTQKSQLSAVQAKLGAVTSNIQILQSIGQAFSKITGAVGNIGSTDPAVIAAATASFNSARDAIVNDLKLLKPTSGDQYSNPDNLGQLQDAFLRPKAVTTGGVTSYQIGGITLPPGETSFSQIQFSDVVAGTAGPGQISSTDLTNPYAGIQSVYTNYTSLQDGIRQSLEEQINTANANIATTQTKITNLQKSDLKTAFGNLTAYKLQASTVLTAISNSFDNQSLLSSQLASALNGSTNTRGSVLNLFG